MDKKKKYYVVWKGYQVGIFDNWNECKRQVEGYSGAKYKSFDSLAEAQDAFRLGCEYIFDQTRRQDECSPFQRLQHHATPPLWQSISVDAACVGNPGKLEYRGVYTDTGKEIFRQGVFEEGTNNIGEFLAIVHALAFLQKNAQFDMPIYTDSLTALSWIREKKAKTQLTENERNKSLFELLKRAEQWLNTHTYANPILYWRTDLWGEIPADFGRK
ncbi:MAG: ribonuclease H family protein [Microscillaceae bacterium]|nr:ribonuclease H family protein [Microscillaceae bacterium]MDW8461866.1 ribonuclease H family protein [Cytophagales bacterium]